MAHKDGLVVALMLDDRRVAREYRDNGEDQIFLPFGSEYFLRFKNMRTTRVLVHVDIDGERVTGGGLVIEPNTESDLKGKISGSIAHNRFKFIEKTDGISQYRGDRIDDGLIRVEYQFEKPRNKYWETNPSQPSIPWDPYRPWGNFDFTEHQKKFLPNEKPADWRISRSATTRRITDGGTKYNPFITQTKFSVSNYSGDVVPDAPSGITVPGSVVDQRFHTVSLGEMYPDKFSMVFRLKAEFSTGQPVSEARVTQGKFNAPLAEK